MNIEILFETDNYWVINKPPFLSVHPGAGEQITLSEIWSEKHPSWDNLNWPQKDRPGIIHRLDKDTSGIMLLAKNPDSLIRMQELFKNKKIKKTYLALVVGKSKEKKFTVEASIGRERENRQKQSTSQLDLPWEISSKPAITNFIVKDTFSLKKYIITEFFCFPETGRMHQIRVHLKLKNLPIVGDQKYSNKLSRHFNKEYNIKRQMLHAQKIEFIDPWTKKKVSYTSEPLADYQQLISLLK